LKGVDLLWFVGIGGGTINSWDEMKEAFLMKYQVLSPNVGSLPLNWGILD
jgi:hypothetical protein